MSVAEDQIEQTEPEAAARLGIRSTAAEGRRAESTDPILPTERRRAILEARRDSLLELEYL